MEISEMQVSAAKKKGERSARRTITKTCSEGYRFLLKIKRVKRVWAADHRSKENLQREVRYRAKVSMMQVGKFTHRFRHFSIEMCTIRQPQHALSNCLGTQHQGAIQFCLQGPLPANLHFQDVSSLISVGQWEFYSINLWKFIVLGTLIFSVVMTLGRKGRSIVMYEKGTKIMN